MTVNPYANFASRITFGPSRIETTYQGFHGDEGVITRVERSVQRIEFGANTSFRVRGRIVRALTVRLTRTDKNFLRKINPGKYETERTVTTYRKAIYI